MTVQIGAGGIVSDVYQQYYSFDKWITLEYDSTHSTSEGPIYEAENVFQWQNAKNGFHSKITEDQSTHFISFHFYRPILLRHFSFNDVP